MADVPEPGAMGELLSDPKVYTAVGLLVCAVVAFVREIIVPGVTHRERMADNNAMWQKRFDDQRESFTARLADKEAARVDWKDQAKRSIAMIEKMVPPSVIART